MWYQVVSPPNMPRSRLSCAGKVHSATTQEATPSAISRATVCTCGALTSRRLAGRHPPAEQRGAEADRDAADDRPAEGEDAQRAQQLQREDQQRGGDRRVGEAGQRAGELGHDPAPQPVAAEAERRDDADRRQAAAEVGAEGGGHGRGMLFAAPGVRSARQARRECGRRRRCRPGRSSRSAPCAGTAGGSPRRSRRAPAGSTSVVTGSWPAARSASS